MTRPSTLRHAGLAALLALAPWTASAQLAVSANDHKMVWDNGLTRPGPSGGPDTVTVIDLGSYPPVVVGEVNAPATVAGPPQTVAVSPNQAFALVTSGQKLDPADPSKIAPDNRLSVIDLRARPLRVTATMEVGPGAAGVSLNRRGDLALIANRGDGTVSVLEITGGTIRVVDTVKVGKPDSLPSHVVFANDDRLALVTLQNEHAVTVLRIEGTRVTPTQRDISVGLRPYAIATHPSGRFVLVANVGRSSGDADTLSVIDTTLVPPRVVDTVNVGHETPEGLVISRDGRWVAVVAHAGSTKAPTSPLASPTGRVILFRVEGMKLERVGEAAIGRWSQGAVFSRDGKTLLVQNMVERNLQVFDLTGQRLVDTGLRVPLKGGGAAIRTAE